MKTKIEQTREEKVKFLMKLTKRELAEMNVTSNEIIEQLTRLTTPFVISSTNEENHCQICGCFPSVIVSTQKGRFCLEHAKY